MKPSRPSPRAPRARLERDITQRVVQRQVEAAFTQVTKAANGGRGGQDKAPGRQTGG